MAVDWSDLPPELLETIGNKLKVYADYVRFRAVCVNWRSSIPNIPKIFPCQLPWLMLPQSLSHPSHRRAFFSLSSNKLHFLTLPEASNRRRIRGSSHGWLVILEESPYVFLVNPLTRAKVRLPPLSSFPNVIAFSFHEIGREYSLRSTEGDLYTCSLMEMRDSFIKKVILSSIPSNNSDFVALAIVNHTGDLAYCKIGDHSWTIIEDAQFYSEDVIYHQGQFYAVSKSGAIAVCDVHGDSPRVSFIDTQPQFGGDLQYLVNSMGELLLVSRYLNFEFNNGNDIGFEVDVVYETIEFQVFRLDLSSQKWERVTSIGDRILFLGENSSLALSASDFPGCKENRIYYTDDYSELNNEGVGGDHDLGVYSLEDGSIETLPCYPRCSESGIHLPPPIWVTPNPC